MINSIRRVTLTIETDRGEIHTLVVDEPEPRGGNPRFLSKQLDTAVSSLQEHADKILETYAHQVRTA